MLCFEVNDLKELATTRRSCWNKVVPGQGAGDESADAIDDDSVGPVPAAAAASVSPFQPDHRFLSNADQLLPMHTTRC